MSTTPSTTLSTTLNTTLNCLKPSIGFCVYYGIMSEYPDTMDYPNAYEIDCNGELLLIMPLINNEALLVLLHSRSKQDDPNAWSYSCTVNGELTISVDNRVLSPTSFLSPFLNLCFEICMSICWKKRSTRNKI